MTATLHISIRYFASVREALGAGEEVDVAAGTTLKALRLHLIGSSAAHARALSLELPLRYALNQAMCDEHAELTANSEVAIFPPVTGG